MRFLILLSVLLVGCSEPDSFCKESITLLETEGIRGQACESNQKMVITKLSDTVLQVTCTCPPKIESRK